MLEFLARVLPGRSPHHTPKRPKEPQISQQTPTDPHKTSKTQRPHAPNICTRFLPSPPILRIVDHSSQHLLHDKTSTNSSSSFLLPYLLCRMRLSPPRHSTGDDPDWRINFYGKSCNILYNFYIISFFWGKNHWELFLLIVKNTVSLINGLFHTTCFLTY